MGQGIQSIASSSSAGSAYPTRPSASVLEAQLNRYEVQLADWCNCGSAKTPEGKAKIQDLTNKADTIKAQLEKIHLAKSSSQPPSAALETPSGQPPSRQSPTLSATPSLGNRVNVFA